MGKVLEDFMKLNKENQAKVLELMRGMKADGKEK